MRRVPLQAMKMPKAWPVVASELNDQLGWWQMFGGSIVYPLLATIRTIALCRNVSTSLREVDPSVPRLGKTAFAQPASRGQGEEAYA